MKGGRLINNKNISMVWITYLQRQSMMCLEGKLLKLLAGMFKWEIFYKIFRELSTEFVDIVALKLLFIFLLVFIAPRLYFVRV